MFLKRLFGFKTNTESPEPEIEKSKEKIDQAQVTQETESPPKHTDANVGYPFYNVKATSFPPPLSIDASVYTDMQKEKQVPEENKKDEKEKQTEIVDETKNGEKKTSDSLPKLPCDLQTCTKEKCNPQTCETSVKGSLKHVSEDKITPTKLTAIINSSIKEAMEIIVKQCRMDEKKDVDKKPIEETVTSVCRQSKTVAPVKTKLECQPHTLQESNNRLKTSRSCRLSKRYNNYRLYSNKLCEENAKHRNKKGTVCEQAKKKKHSKPLNNVKTDNRRMTGNVNIYICSEANEKAQETAKQTDPKPCMTTTESSSESTTEQSGISLSKLVTCIRDKRRKSKEQTCLDYLPKREDDSEASTTCTSKYIDSSSIKLQSDSFIDICNADDKSICVKETISVLTDCKCEDANISNIEVDLGKSESSVEEAQFVICDKIEKPCATIYTTKSLSNSESDGWSSKSAGSSQITDCIPSDNWSLEPNLHDADSEEEHHKTCKRRLGNANRYCKRDAEITGKYNIRCNCKNRKYPSKGAEKENSVQPWSTCNCIAEEEEEEVECKSQDSEKLSQDGEGKISVCRREKLSQDEEEKITVCGKEKLSQDAEETITVEDKYRRESESSKELAESPEQLKISERQSDKKEILTKTKSRLKEEAGIQRISSIGKKTQQPTQAGTQQVKPIFIRGRLVRPEVIVLKTILKQQVPGKYQKEETIKPETESKTEKPASPDILKKYIMRDLHAYQKQAVSEEKESIPREKDEKIPKEIDSEKDKDIKSLKAWLKETFLSKCLRKITGKSEDPETKLEEHTAEDKKVESTPTNVTPDKHVKVLKTEVDGNQLPDKTTTEIKSVLRERDKPKDLTISSTTQPKELNISSAKQPKDLNISSATQPKDLTISSTKQPKDVTISSPKQPKDLTISSTMQPKAEENLKRLATNSSPVAKHEPILKDETEASTSNTVKKKQVFLPSEHSHIETAKEIQSEKSSQLSDSLNTKENVNYVTCKESEFQDTRKLESQTICTQNEKQDRMQLDVLCDKKSITVCGQFSSRKLQPKEVKKSQCYKSEPHTVCTNSKYAKCPSANEYFIDEKNTSNYCCSSVSQKSNETVNYPKSCLKKERPCCCHCVHDKNSSISYQDKRYWKECCCRRIILCNGCYKPKNECRCKIPPSCPNCYKPKNKCNCKAVQEVKNSCACMKSMFCLYCDNPRDKCTCRTSIQKCTCCKLSMDLCTCKNQETICEGRQVRTEPDSDQIMYVTAWKPREEVRRYFSRNLTDRQTDSISECCCHEKLKPHKSNDLPYQRLSVFSDVMNELQHKISESTCCTRCKKIPCCCSIKPDRDEGREERKIKYCISPKTRRKIIAVCVNKSSSKLSNNCKRDPNQTRDDKSNKIIVPLYCVCKATPCKCRKSKTNQKKPKAKCYYCKSSPCICITSRERNKLRPCRCTDSPCRTKEKDNVPCGKTSTKLKNNDEKPICMC